VRLRVEVGIMLKMIKNTCIAYSINVSACAKVIRLSAQTCNITATRLSKQTCNTTTIRVFLKKDSRLYYRQ